MPVVMLLAVLAVLAGVVVVATGRGGELSKERADYAPLQMGNVTATDVVLFRAPTGLWGYSMAATEEALDKIAVAIRDRDVRIIALEQRISDLIGQEHYAPLPPLATPAQPGLTMPQPTLPQPTLPQTAPREWVAREWAPPEMTPPEGTPAEITPPEESAAELASEPVATSEPETTPDQAAMDETSEHEAPASEREAPASGHETPASGHETPASGHETPASERDAVASDGAPEDDASQGDTRE